jgi:hypothetical protein
MSPEEDFALGETDLLGDHLIKLQVNVDSFIDMLRKFSPKSQRFVTANHFTAVPIGAREV